MLGRLAESSGGREYERKFFSIQRRIDFGEHEAIGPAREPAARQTFVLKHVDAQRRPSACARFDIDAVCFVVGIWPARYD